jgi:hypothetical protein
VPQLTSSLPSIRELDRSHVFFCSCNKYPTIECFSADGHVTPNLNMDAATTFSSGPGFLQRRPDNLICSAAVSSIPSVAVALLGAPAIGAPWARKRQGSFWIVHG